MQQPTQEQLDALQKKYYALETRVNRLDEESKQRDFTIRDSAVKIGIAEGLAKTTHSEISQLKLEMIALRAEMKELRETSHQQFEGIHQKLDRQEAMTKENGDMLRQLLAKLQ